MTARPTTRRLCVTEKVKTEFGSLYVQVDFDEAGVPVGGTVATPGKAPESQIDRLIEQISGAMNGALKGVREAVLEDINDGGQG